ncbi:hypothetical protein [Azorhizobium sp. AG788]|uniref:LysE family translocator n=1 Tax=Azorhizobium sp. AG788 TaxID=2183897 RepID=UPI0031390A42
MTLDLAFVLSVAALLSVPGPTNTLLAAAGAAGGPRHAVRLVPAELAGYLVTIGLLCTLVGPLVAGHATVLMAFRLAAAVYIAVSAVGLWQPAAGVAGTAPAAIGPHKVFVATLLNPKGLIFAFVIFPKGGLATLPPALAVFSAVLLVIGTGWVLLGHLIARSAGRFATPRGISRSAAVALGVFALILLGSALAPVAGPLFSPAP